MAKKLNKLDLQVLTSVDTAPTGFVAFAAKSDGLYQKVGTTESKLSTTAELLDRVKTPVPEGAKFTDTNTVYTHPTSAGNKHIPTGGATNQILRYSASGTAVWSAENNTTYGIVTTAANGLMIAADKSKLDGIATGANNYVHPSTHPISFITGLQGALDLKATPADISTAIDGIEIGVRNYFSIEHTKLTPNIGGYKTVTIQLLPNTQYIVSTSVPEISPTSFNIFADKNPISRSSATNGFAVNKPKLITTDSTGKIDISAPASFIDNIINGTYWCQVEKGNKVTDWKPAPEDQVSDWNTTDATSFSYIKNKPTQLSQFTDNIGVATHIANKANPHAVTTAQIGAVDLTTSQTITGAKTFENTVYINSNATAAYTAFRLSSLTKGEVGYATNHGGVFLRNNTANKNLVIRDDGTVVFNGSSITAPTFIGALSGNASSATKLQTARTIAGVNFDGTANIAIPFANLASKPTTLAGYGITDGVQINNDNWANFRYVNFAIADKDALTDGQGLIKLDGWYALNIGAGNSYGTRLTINGQMSHDKTQLYFNGGNGSIQYRKSWHNNTAWTALRTIWDSSNLTNLNQLTTRNFSDLQNKPTTLSGYGITDGVTSNATQTITGTKTFSKLLTASAGINTTTLSATTAINLGTGWKFIQSGTEMHMQYNGVTKQRFLSDGSIVAVGEITAITE